MQGVPARAHSGGTLYCFDDDSVGGKRGKTTKARTHESTGESVTIFFFFLFLQIALKNMAFTRISLSLFLAFGVFQYYFDLLQ